jgi:hypothetical protein
MHGSDEASQQAEHEARVNQHRHEPVPASHRAGADEPVAGSGEPGTGRDQPGAGHEERPAAAADEPPQQGKAIRDMMGGPGPQGDVPDAPATQIAAADNEEGQGPRVRHVANAVPGKPDGEVDTRS